MVNLTVDHRAARFVRRDQTRHLLEERKSRVEAQQSAREVDLLEIYKYSFKRFEKEYVCGDIARS